jgi:hypothetical protein
MLAEQNYTRERERERERERWAPKSGLLWVTLDLAWLVGAYHEIIFFFFDFCIPRKMSSHTPG